MHKIKILKFIVICLTLCSCKSDQTNYKELQFADYYMKIKIPIDFDSANEQEIKDFYISGSKEIKKLGYDMDSLQNNLLFLNKGEFSSIKIKYYFINNEVIKDYENQWRNLNKSTFDMLNKTKMSNSTLDTISRIENINNTKFYVFESNNNFLDLNNNKAKFTILRYSTPLENMDFVINAEYDNQTDERKIKKSIESIIINKK
jgi:hypothetical protein